MTIPISLAGALAASMVVVGACASRAPDRPASRAPTRPAAKPFRVYDNTQYSNTDLSRIGLIRSAIVEETPAQAREIAAGLPPDRSAFQRAVAARASVPGPIVLDFEDLYLTGSRAVATRHLEVLITLARWARAAAPGKVIGFYGVLDQTAARYLTLAARLAPLEGAFFPSMYTFKDDRRRWRMRLADNVARGHRIAPHKPIYPYIWPQYHEGTPRAGQFIESGYWAAQLSAALHLADGVVIWSKRVRNASNGWVDATARFMRRLVDRPKPHRP